MTSSIELMLKLTGSVAVRRADFLSPTTSLGRTIPYYDQHRAAEAVYGGVTPTGSGGYAIDLDVWNASKPNGKPTAIRRTISNVLSSFKLADEMSLRVASAIVGRKLEEGTLVVQNVSSLPEFSVYANGHLLGRNRTSFHILTGSWKIVIAKPGEVGDVAVDTFHVDIQQGETAIVALSQAPPSQAGTVNRARAPRSARPALSSNKGIGSRNGPTPVLTVSRPTGSISITTATAGTLYLDGKLMGHIPSGGASLNSVGVGIRSLTMHYADGHEARREVSVEAGRTTNASFSYRGIPGSRWIEHTLPGNQDWQSLTYGNGTFVAVAFDSSSAGVSSDGVNWAEDVLPTIQKWSSVTYGNGTFVAVAFNSDVVATSSDGINWTEHTLPTSEGWSSVTYGNNTFVAVASNSNVVATSSDGVNWTAHTMPSSKNWRSVTYGNGIFVAVAAYGNVVATSSDGTHWNEGSLPASEVWQSVTYGDGTFVAVASYSNVAAISSNGINWTEGHLPAYEDWQSVAYGKGTFVVVAFNSRAACSI